MLLSCYHIACPLYNCVSSTFINVGSGFMLYYRFWYQGGEELLDTLRELYLHARAAQTGLTLSTSCPSIACCHHSGDQAPQMESWASRVSGPGVCLVCIREGFCIGFEYSFHTCSSSPRNMKSSSDHPGSIHNYIREDVAAMQIIGSFAPA